MKLMYFLSLLSIPIYAMTAIVMYQRKQHKIYPVFWAYLVFQASRIVVEGIGYFTSYAVFFYSYWGSSALSVVFRLLLLRGIFLTVLEGYSPLNRVRRLGYEIALIVFWAVALLLAYDNHGGHKISHLIFNSSQAASLVAVGMFIFVAGSSALFGIHWTSAVCGIALGVGLLGIVDLAVFAALCHNHLISTNTAGWIETITYDCAAAIFAFFFVPTREATVMHPTNEPVDLEWAQWLRGIKDALWE